MKSKFGTYHTNLKDLLMTFKNYTKTVKTKYSIKSIRKYAKYNLNKKFYGNFNM